MNDYVCPETEAGSSAVTVLIAIRAGTRRKDMGWGGRGWLGECLKALLFSVGEKSGGGRSSGSSGGEGGVCVCVCVCVYYVQK